MAAEVVAVAAVELAAVPRALAQRLLEPLRALLRKPLRMARDRVLGNLILCERA